MLSKPGVFLEQKPTRESRIGKLTEEVDLRKCTHEQIRRYGIELESNWATPGVNPTKNSEAAPQVR